VSRYRCVDAQKAAGFPVVAACRAAGVSVSAFYAWGVKGEQGPRAAEQAEAELVAEIRTIHAESGGIYGSPRVTAELRRRGWRVNHKRVERLMAEAGIVGHRPRRRRSLTKPDTAAPPAPDLVGRLFAPDQPDRIWVSDLTYIPTDEGWLYLASVLDLASRHLLGWSMDECHDAGLVVGALEAAVATRGRRRMDGTIFHSDRGAGIHLGRLHRGLRAAGAAPIDGPHRVVPGQRGRRVVLRHPQGRVGRPLPLPHPRAGASLDLPLDRLVQRPSAAFHQRLPTAAGVGTATPSQPPATVNPGRIATVSGQRGEVHYADWSGR
jgi:transposase InsO family protein